MPGSGPAGSRRNPTPAPDGLHAGRLRAGERRWSRCFTGTEGWRNGAARHEHGPGTTRKPDTPGGLPQLRWQQPGQCELIRNPRGSSGDSDRLLPKGSPVRPPSTDPAGQTPELSSQPRRPPSQTAPRSLQKGRKPAFQPLRVILYLKTSQRPVKPALRPSTGFL